MQRRLQDLTIPDDLTFADLRVSLESNGGLTVNYAVLNHVCVANDLAVERYRSGDHLAELLATWYKQHLRVGGDPDPAMEDLIGQGQAQHQAGQVGTHTPGHA